MISQGFVGMRHEWMDVCMSLNRRLKLFLCIWRVGMACLPPSHAINESRVSQKCLPPLCQHHRILQYVLHLYIMLACFNLIETALMALPRELPEGSRNKLIPPNSGNNPLKFASTPPIHPWYDRVLLKHKIPSMLLACWLLVVSSVTVELKGDISHYISYNGLNLAEGPHLLSIRRHSKTWRQRNSAAT